MGQGSSPFEPDGIRNARRFVSGVVSERRGDCTMHITRLQDRDDLRALGDLIGRVFHVAASRCVLGCGEFRADDSLHH